MSQAMHAPTVELISRRATVRAIVVCVVIAAGIVSLWTLEESLHLTFTKKPMPLNHPLPLMAKQFGTRYMIEGYDEQMDEAIQEVLGTRDYLLRSYRDLKKKTGDPTEFLKLNVNYYATGSATPHVPEVCWAGAGMTEAQTSRRIFEVPGVPRKDGTVVTLRVRLISFLPRGESENSERLKNVAYVFNVNGEYAATREEVISRFWKASNGYAYNTKIEITIGGPNQYCSQEQAVEAAGDFLKASLSSIEDCLPDRQAGVGGNTPAAIAPAGGFTR